MIRGILAACALLMAASWVHGGDGAGGKRSTTAEYASTENSWKDDGFVYTEASAWTDIGSVQATPGHLGYVDTRGPCEPPSVYWGATGECIDFEPYPWWYQLWRSLTTYADDTPTLTPLDYLLLALLLALLCWRELVTIVRGAWHMATETCGGTLCKLAELPPTASLIVRGKLWAELIVSPPLHFAIGLLLGPWLFWKPVNKPSED
jgi:hypothetical protein